MRRERPKSVAEAERGGKGGVRQPPAPPLRVRQCLVQSTKAVSRVQRRTAEELLSRVLGVVPLLEPHPQAQKISRCSSTLECADPRARGTHRTAVDLYALVGVGDGDSRGVRLCDRGEVRRARVVVVLCARRAPDGVPAHNQNPASASSLAHREGEGEGERNAPRRLDPDGHLGQQRPDSLVLDDRDAKRLACSARPVSAEKDSEERGDFGRTVVGVLGGLGQRALGEPDGARGDERAGDVKRAHRDLMHPNPTTNQLPSVVPNPDPTCVNAP